MSSTYSKSWKASEKPRKQRKYRYNAPDHIQGKFMSSPLSKELRKKHGIRSIRVRKEDKVRIMRGNFRGKEGKVERVIVKDKKVFIDKIEVFKKDGSKAFYPIDPSNLMITELFTDDKKRMKRLKSEKAAGESK